MYFGDDEIVLLWIFGIWFVCLGDLVVSFCFVGFGSI